MDDGADRDGAQEIRIEVWREGITMALYISLSQLAVMTALPGASSLSRLELLRTILLTSVGLVLAHQVAYRMSSRLVAEGSRLEPHAPRVLRAQLLGGAFVTLLALAPVALFGAGAYQFSVLALLVFVMTIGYFVARSVPVSRPRALLYVSFVGLVVVGVLLVKSLVSH